jgi:hypothetical protein
MTQDLEQAFFRIERLAKVGDLPRVERGTRLGTPAVR